MQGIPWELHELPRQMYVNPQGDIFGKPPPANNTNKKKPARTRKGGAGGGSGNGTIGGAGAKAGLEPISESGMRPAQRTDASTSTTDLGETASIAESVDGASSTTSAGPKKVQKGQINALAKMLSALRR
jgi:hypothetical protein